jgi:CDP-diacylglycerol--glycerol-3-phosphate 3-phosphatidyltransferase
MALLWRRHLPNVLTASRLLLYPLMLASFVYEQFALGLGLFTVAATTDFLDGYLARRWRATSTLGAVLDPISDKVLTFSFFALLTYLGSCPLWFFGFIVAAFLFQSAGFLLLYPPGEHLADFAPLRAGKRNVALQFLWIGIALFDLLLQSWYPKNFRFSASFHNAGYAVLAAMQAYTLYSYYRTHRRQILDRLGSPENRMRAP